MRSQSAASLQAMYKSYGTCRELMELRNLTSVGELILMSALQRRASVGGHFCLDDPPHVSSISAPLPVCLLCSMGVACSTLHQINRDCQICLLCDPGKEFLDCRGAHNGQLIAKVVAIARCHGHLSLGICPFAGSC